MNIEMLTPSITEKGHLIEHFRSKGKYAEKILSLFCPSLEYAC
jgi:hypothetical protein